MLRHLSIRNYILIRELEMDFDNGFTVITGETGAGKSIFLGALGLILGERADMSVLSNESEKCIVEGSFEINGVVEPDFFQQNDIEYDTTCIIRREILPQGKSRAFVNDTPVALHILKQLSEKLIDIHSQHSTYLLSDNTFHLSLLDAVAGTSSLYKSFLKQWDDFKKKQALLAQYKAELSVKEKEADYFNFLLNEIEELNTLPGEDEELEQQILSLRHAEKISATLHEVSQRMKLGEPDIHSQLVQIQNLLKSIADVYPRVTQPIERLKSAIIEIDDIASEISSMITTVQSDPQLLAQSEERMNRIQRLLHKHKLNNSAELLTFGEELKKKLSDIEFDNEKINQMEKECSDDENRLKSIAFELSEKRKQIIPTLEKNISEILKSLAMPNAVFRVRMETESQLSSRGFDKVEFLFSSNIGEPPQELSKIASGGELSRVMLALKSVIAQTAQLPTLIFDEIDSGISGEAAKKMAEIFSKMGEKIQLIVISHLPQIAARAKSHILVSKRTEAQTTITEMKPLAHEQRVIEISKMLGGNNYTESTYRTALEMLQQK